MMKKDMMTVKELMEILKAYKEDEIITLSTGIEDYDWAWAALEIGDDTVMEKE